MKTNHRRQNNGKNLIGFDYGYLTSVSLMRHGCSPNYSGRSGAMAAIRGRKVKDERKLRHQFDSALRKDPLGYERQATTYGKSKVFK
jgi:hypothetical protein